MTGSAEETAAAIEVRQRDERVELLRRQVTRRIMNANLSRGWMAWVEMWEARVYAMERLRQVTWPCAPLAAAGSAP